MRFTCGSGVYQAERKSSLGYAYQRRAKNVHTSLRFAILSEISFQSGPIATQRSKDGKMSIIPSTTVAKPGPSRVSGISPTNKRESVHLGSECICWNRGSFEMFMRSSIMFVVLKWIPSCRNLTQWTEIGMREATVIRKRVTSLFDYRSYSILFV